MRSAEEILTILDHSKPELERHFGVRRIGLYGSYAYGTQTEASDIDLIVELQEPKFDALAGLYIYIWRKSWGARWISAASARKLTRPLCVESKEMHCLYE